MDLSIVTTIYCTEASIREFYQRTVKIAQSITEDFEIIFVNDGSPDNGLQIALELHENDPRVVVVDLSRNFGQHKAIMTGLQFTHGERVFLLEGDLEEEPEWLLEFARVMANTDSDVVYGVQKRRRRGWFERNSGEIFYRTLNHLTGIPFPRNVTTARLMTRRYVENLLQYREREIFLGGVFHIIGFEQVPVKVQKLDISPTSYSFHKKISITVSAITSFSSRPLVFIFYVGSIISFISFMYILVIVIRNLLWGVNLVGWPSLIASIWFLGGLMILFLGVIGIYLAKMFIEIKDRPYTSIRAVYRGSEQYHHNDSGIPPSDYSHEQSPKQSELNPTLLSGRGAKME